MSQENDLSESGVWGKDHVTKSKCLNDDCEDLLYNYFVIKQKYYSLLVKKTYRGTLLTSC